MFGYPAARPHGMQLHGHRQRLAQHLEPLPVGRHY
jgi:hypothetical protein